MMRIAISVDGPFTGVRVLELSTGTAGRTAGMLLADFGAEVVRVLPPGDPPRPDDPRLLCWDRGKLLTRIDRPDQLRRLAGSCDVLLTDAVPGELEPLGLDAAAMLDRAAGLVHAWLPPYATRGRWSRLPEDPLLLAALGGIAAHYPATTDRPVAPVVPTVSYLHGATAHEVPACPVLAIKGELSDPFLVENDFSHLVHDPGLGRLRVVRGYAEWR